MNHSFHRLPFAAALAATFIISPHALAQNTPPPVAPPQAWPAQEPVLVVRGDGEVRADPDTAVIRLGAMAQAREAAQAQQQVNEIMQRALEAVKEQGVEENRISTSDLSLYPVYDDRQRPQQGGPNDDEPRIVGYRASNTIRIELSDLTKLGAVVDAAIGAGANQMHGIEFSLRNDTEARSQALRQAVQSARAKAQVLAEAAGVELGGPLEVRESGTDISPPEPMYRMASRQMAESAPTPVQPGQLDVQASVTLVYRISSSGENAAAEQE